MSTTSKKVLFIVPAINKKSGWGRLVYEVTVQFEKKSITYAFCAEDADPQFQTASFVQLKKGWNGFIRNILTVRKIAQDYDIIHAFDGWPYSIYGYFACVGTAKKLYITGVGTYSVLPLFSWSKAFWMKKAYLRAEQIMCISRYTQQRILEKVPRARVSVVHMGLTLLPRLSTQALEERSKRFTIDSAVQKPMLVTVGAIKNRKGQRDVVAAVALLVRKYPNLLYVMIGSDKDIPYVESVKKIARAERIEKNIRIIANAHSDEDLSFFYQTCDMFLLVSRNSANHHFEGFGLVILEAGQFGKPAIGSLDCGVADAVLEGQTGFLVPQGRPDAIAEAVEKILIAGPDSFSKKTEAFAMSFSWEATADAYIAAYEKSS